MIVSTAYKDETIYMDRVVLLHEGMILQSGTPAEICRNYRGNLWEIRGIRPTSERLASFCDQRIRAVYPFGKGIRFFAEEMSNRELEELASTVGSEEKPIPIEPSVGDIFHYSLLADSRQKREA